MAAYIITYDLNSPGQDYRGLHAAIKKYKTHWRFVDSNWIIETSDSAVQIRNKLAPHLDSNDKLFVAKLSGEAAWRGFSDKGTKWLKARLQPKPKAPPKG